MCSQLHSHQRDVVKGLRGSVSFIEGVGNHGYVLLAACRHARLRVVAPGNQLSKLLFPRRSVFLGTTLEITVSPAET